MKELIQRLSALDDDASSAMKVIAYFDTLLAQGAGLEAFTRGAAVLSGWPAGLFHPHHNISLRVDALGRSMPPLQHLEAIQKWPHYALEDGSAAVVWIERPESSGTLDNLLLERTAAGVHLTIDRVSPMGLVDDAGAVEILVTSSSTEDARRKAAGRLRLREDARIRLVASRLKPPSARPPRSTVVSTAAGKVRATIVALDEAPPDTQAGIGPVVPILEAHKTWGYALSAMSLSSTILPQVRWDEWGALAGLAATAGNVNHPDVDRIAQLVEDPAARDTLEALALSESARVASARLGLHHSTVQSRQLRLEEALGFHITTPMGRTRVLVALAVVRSRTPQSLSPEN